MNQPTIKSNNGGSSSSSTGNNSTKIQELTKGNPTKSNAIEVPSISLPKGGGALKGIDEKFEVNPSNGTASFSIPLPISPGRNGFAPGLALSYNSGGGNSKFGLGWNVSVPSIGNIFVKTLHKRFSVAFTTMAFSGGLERALQEKTNLGFNHASQIKKVLDFNPDYRQVLMGHTFQIY